MSFIFYQLPLGLDLFTVYSIVQIFWRLFSQNILQLSTLNCISKLGTLAHVLGGKRQDDQEFTVAWDTL